MEYDKLQNNDNLEKILLKYNFAKEVLETELKILLKEYEYINKYNPIEHIKSRMKTSNSVINKLNKKGYKLTTENILLHVHDMIGIRIVCSFLSDVSNVVQVIKNSKLFKIKEERDYISNPKDSGYLSYHMIVLVPIHLQEKTEYIEAEIQIRTIAMDFWASLDHKLRYKIDQELPPEIIKEICNFSLDINELDIKMEKIRKSIDIYKNNLL